MNFREWLNLINEDVFYNSNFKGWATNAQQLSGLAPDKKNILKNVVLQILAGENWNGRNAKQFVNAVRHKCLDYNDQMDRLRQMPSDRPGRCKKIPERIKNVKMAYYLVQAIIDQLAPPNIHSAASVENYEWMKKSYEFYKNEDMKLGANCERFVKDIWIVPPQGAAQVA